MAETLTLRVTEELAGERVDKAVARLLGISRSEAAAICARGVVVDGVGASASERVAAGQSIECEAPAEAVEIEAEDLPIDVAYEDDHLVVVDKRPGMVVHPGAGNRRGTLVAALLHRFPGIVGVGETGRWGLVHRLDRDTSGLMVVALTGEAHRRLSRQIRERAVSRDYLALVEGQMDAPTGTIEAPLGRDPSTPTRRAVIATGKPARTHFEAIEPVLEGAFTLVEVQLETGRTHQIRAHMASIGHPVAGDRLYGASKRVPGLGRNFLHATRLSFTHPVTGEVLTFESPLPSDLASPLDALREGGKPHDV